MYIAPGQGQTAPRGQNFDVNRKALSFYHLLQVSKKSLYSPGLGAYSPQGTKF